jgi:hypothetical protein
MRILHPALVAFGRLSCPEIRQIHAPLSFVRQLDRRSVFSIRIQSSTRINCRSGRIWITCGGDSKDLILHAGESMETKRRTSVVIEALEEAVIEIETDRRRIRKNAA